MSSITATPYGSPSSGSARIRTGWLVAGAVATALVATGVVVGPRIWSSSPAQTATTSGAQVRTGTATGVVGASTYTVPGSAYAPGGSLYRQQVPAGTVADGRYSAHLAELGALAASTYAVPGSAYAPGGSVYRQQVPAGTIPNGRYSAHLEELGALAATSGTVPRYPTARAGGPDALELHRQTATSAYGASQQSLESHFGTGTGQLSGGGTPKRGYR